MADVQTRPSPEARADLLRAVLAGLAEPQKRLPGKLLWDETGSNLFDRICNSASYYPTRTEMALLPSVAADVAATTPPGVIVVEFGSGASRKIRTLLDALDQPSRFVALDISGEYLEAALRRLAPDYPQVEMIPICADYSQPVRLPVDLSGEPVLGFFPGTSIGNFVPEQAKLFLRRARTTLGPSRFLVGVDPTRDPARLARAYGDADGLMAALHRNLLARLNRECNADFALDNFRHEARVRDDPFRVEAHLVTLASATYHIGSMPVRFEAGESIHTDNSHKYSPDAFRALAEQAGWHSERIWLAADGAFSLHLLGA
ncbi:MAG: L-histidine N(alpha)-methyltransferase [Methylorubrum rhodinum]|uniref:L-histidine N(alpha)-methyltransferase n=1 Tax=Methylorubrum rhodinum TaxID=29428 RepID=UPI003BB04CC8